MSEQLPETEDYGLAPDEQFEPELPDERAFNLARPHVMTVRGPIEPDALGVALPYEHLLVRLPGHDKTRCDILDDEHLVLAELEDFYVVGGKAIVDATPADWGRDLATLRWIAERSPVTIVAATGAGGPLAPEATADSVAECWIRELRDGVAGSGVRPGVIVINAAAGEVALRAAARAQVATGVPALTTAPVREVRPIMDELGVSPDRVVVAVEAQRLAERAEPVLAAGFWLLIDRIGLGAGGEGALKDQARQTWRLIEAGLAGRILFSLNYSRRAEWRGGGGEGWGMILERWPLALMELGLDAITIRQILVENPAQALAVRM